jgi:putative peptidoglycan lipid II flippase
MSQAGKHESEHFFGAAKLMAALTMLSRVLGLVRDMVVVPLGGPILADRFWLAFAIPNLFRRLFGEGALSAAFVPVFTEVTETKGWDRAREILANCTGILAMLLAGLVLLIDLGLLAAWWIWGGDAYHAFLLQQTAIMLPYMPLVCLLALGSAALNCKGHFAYPAFAPVLLNIVLIATAVWIAPAMSTDDATQLTVLAWAVVLAGVVQWIGVLWVLRTSNLLQRPTLRPVLPEVRQIGALMAPMVIPLSVLQFGAFVDRFIALLFGGGAAWQPMQPGVVRCLYASSRLYMLPLGVLAIPIATVIFPLLGRYAARKDELGLRRVTNRALRLAAFLGIPAGVGLMVLAEPIVEVFFRRKDFTAFDADRTTRLLQAYSVGMWAYFANHILLRAFFAIKEPRKPMVISIIAAVGNIGFVTAMIFTPLRSTAFGVGTALTAWSTAVVLVVMLRRRWGPIGLRKIAIAFVKIMVASGFMVAAILGVWKGLDLLRSAGSLPILAGKSGILAGVLASVAGGMVVYFVAVWMLGCDELAELRRRKHPADSEEPAGNDPSDAV